MKSVVVRKTKDILFETRKRYYKNKDKIKKNISVDLGWRKLLFSQTFDNNQYFIKETLKPHKGENAAIYIHNPQILMEQSQGQLTLDPSVCYRLDLSKYEVPKRKNKKVVVRKIMKKDVKAVNEIYKCYHMASINLKTVKNNQGHPAITYFVAENDGQIVGIVIGVNHVELFNSPEKGSSLWGLAILPGNKGRGIGKLLINYIVEHYQTKGIAYIDLYVDYDNKKAINLYRKVGFKKIPRFYLLPKKDLLKNQ